MKEKRQLKIANICYANVSSLFASFCNPKNRGPLFDWNRFPEMMAERSGSVLVVNNIDGEEERVLAKKYSQEIAKRMVKEAGFSKTENTIETFARSVTEGSDVSPEDLFRLY